MQELQLNKKFHNLVTDKDEVKFVLKNNLINTDRCDTKRICFRVK